jgi:hypothetical protein
MNGRVLDKPLRDTGRELVEIIRLRGLYDKPDRTRVALGPAHFSDRVIEVN